MTGQGHNLPAGARLRSFIERVERLDEEIKSLNADKSEIYKEARGEGFDAKVMRKVVTARKMDSADREEQDALFDLYWSAIHGEPEEAPRARARAREENEQPVPTSLAGDDGHPQPSSEASQVNDAREQAGVSADHGSAHSEQEQASAPQGGNPAASESGASVNDNSDGLDIPEFLRRPA
jgi:uncharacterized protein (UPF0335 family)